MSDFGVIYFSHGTKHLARLVVSLYSLRKHYSGPVTILDTGDSEQSLTIINKVIDDGRLAVEYRRINFVPRQRHSCYVAKASLWRESPYDCTLLLDADTLILRPIDQLKAIICDRNNPGFVVTRFSDWVTTGNIVSGRLKQWKDVTVRGLDVAGALKRSLKETHAAINTGCVGMRRDAEDTLRAWEKLTIAGWECSFTDEISAQLLIRLFPHTLIADYYNHSVLYGKQSDKAVIVHAHGSKHLRPEMGGRWLAAYHECFSLNIGGIADWTPAGDPALTEYLASAKATA